MTFRKIFCVSTTMLLLSFFIACSDDDDNASQNLVDQLPEATQEGKNTIGCLVDGEVLLPRGGGLSGNTNCFYQYVDGGYFFSVSYSNDNLSILKSIGIFTRNKDIEENNTYDLEIDLNDDVGRGANYSVYNNQNTTHFSTSSEVTGELEITKLDTQNGIVSGTFWFDAVNAEGDVVEIREGRFDMLYTD